LLSSTDGFGVFPGYALGFFAWVAFFLFVPSWYARSAFCLKPMPLSSAALRENRSVWAHSVHG
jgi:hypothetical protein